MPYDNGSCVLLANHLGPTCKFISALQTVVGGLSLLDVYFHNQVCMCVVLCDLFMCFACVDKDLNLKVNSYCSFGCPY